jgi:acyl-CoA synthetase (AMP-forming)/AMP-acid ligase II
MLGYLGDDSTVSPAWWATGDVGRVDGDGFLHIDGRQRNVLITSFGRNVSPEWIESELQASPAIAQAVVFGEGRPALAAVLWPGRVDTTDGDLARAVAQANARLPDYARIAHWMRGHAPYNASSGMATPNGRPRRDAIAAAHADALAAEAATEISFLPENPGVPRPTAGVDR